MANMPSFFTRANETLMQTSLHDLQQKIRRLEDENARLVSLISPSEPEPPTAQRLINAFEIAVVRREVSANSSFAEEARDDLLDYITRLEIELAWVKDAATAVLNAADGQQIALALGKLTQALRP